MPLASINRCAPKGEKNCAFNRAYVDCRRQNLRFGRSFSEMTEYFGDHGRGPPESFAATVIIQDYDGSKIASCRNLPNLVIYLIVESITAECRGIYFPTDPPPLFSL